MNPIQKPLEAASVLVRLGGILQLCCEPLNGAETRVGVHRSYVSPVYQRGGFISAPGLNNYDWHYNSEDVRLHNQYREGYRREANRRSFPGLRRHRLRNLEIDSRNILQYRNIKDVTSVHQPPYYYTTFLNKNTEDVSESSIYYTTSTANPWIITDVPTEPWDSKHWVPSERYTIMPTISVVQAWDHLPFTHKTYKDIENDLLPSGNNINQDYINPTPVYWSPTKKSRWKGIKRTVEVPKNMTGRFFDMLRTVITGAEIAKNNLSHSAEDLTVVRDATQNNLADENQVSKHSFSPVLLQEFLEQDSRWKLLRKSDGTLIDATQKEPKISSTDNFEEKGVTFTPVLQICAVMGVIVILLILLFHQHHIRRECVIDQTPWMYIKQTFTNTYASRTNSIRSSSSSCSSVITMEPQKINDVTL